MKNYFLRIPDSKNSLRKQLPYIFADEGEEEFRKMEKEALYNVTETTDSFVLACGGGTPCYFNNIAYMKSLGTVVWINTSQENLFKRLIEEKEKRPLIKNLSTEHIRGFISKKLADRRIYYEEATLKVDDELITIDSLIEKIFHA